jgi:hypothetical protein
MTLATPKFCTGEAGCPGVVLARGLCQAHYSAQRRRKAGVAPRGPKKEARVEFLSEQQVVDRFEAVAPARARSALLRRSFEVLVRRLERKAARLTIPRGKASQGT